MAFPDEILLGLKRETGRGGSGYIGINDLVKLAGYHTVRRIKVGTESFGLVEYPKAKAAADVRKMQASFAERQARLQEKHPGQRLVMRASIYLIPPQHNETSWDLWIHRVFISVGDTDSYYPVSA